MQEWWWLPAVIFAMLATCEQAVGSRGAADAQTGIYTQADWLLNLAGLLLQGVAVPLSAYVLSVTLLPALLPRAAGSLELGWWGGFVLNFVAVDFLYYWQHRWFHRARTLWALHLCHHASTRVDVWATSRNSLLINFLFVYLAANALLGYLCDVPQGFFFGAALTASLDLWRHARLPWSMRPNALSRAVSWLMVTPRAHHLHHSAQGVYCNFGANFMLWDRLFGTATDPLAYPERYGLAQAPAAAQQFLLPWRAAR